MPDLTDFHTDADVYSSDGHKLGVLKGVVLRRADLTVTRIIVDIGFLRSGRSILAGGLGLDYDRVLPLVEVESVSDDRVDLKLTAEEFKQAGEYTEESYETPQDVSPNEFDRTDFVERSNVYGSVLMGTAGFWVVEKLRREQDESDLREGMPLWRQEPHEKIGEIERILADSTTGQAAALVIKRGFLLTRDVVVPLRYVTEILDHAVYVEISDDELDALAEYDG